MFNVCFRIKQKGSSFEYIVFARIQRKQYSQGQALHLCPRLMQQIVQLFLFQYSRHVRGRQKCEAQGETLHGKGKNATRGMLLAETISLLFWVLDMLYTQDIIRADHFQGLIVPAKKTLCHKTLIFCVIVAIFNDFFLSRRIIGCYKCFDNYSH